MPSAVPNGGSGLNVTTSANFKGLLVGDPTTGVIRVSNAQPAGVYTVTVRAIVGAGTIQKTFLLTVSTGTSCTTTPTFSSGTEVSIGSNPAAIALGDMNNDGKFDLVTANQGDNTNQVANRNQAFSNTVNPFTDA